MKTKESNHRYEYVGGIRFKFLKLEEAIKLPTPRLLNYYKKYNHKWKSNFICACCHEFYWNIEKGNSNTELEYNALIDYFNKLKEELNKREHVSI